MCKTYIEFCHCFSLTRGPFPPQLRASHAFSCTCRARPLCTSMYMMNHHNSFRLLHLHHSFSIVWCFEQFSRGPNQERSQACHEHKVLPKAPYNCRFTTAHDTCVGLVHFNTGRSLVSVVGGFFSLFWENPILPLPLLVLLTHPNTSPATASCSPAMVQFSEYAGPRRCHMAKELCWFCASAYPNLRPLPSQSHSSLFPIGSWCQLAVFLRTFKAPTSTHHILLFLQLSQRNHHGHWLGCHELLSA